MNRNRRRMSRLMLVCMTGFGCLLSASGIADDERGRRGCFEREDQHGFPFSETDNEGNETAGQIAAWFLLAANVPVALSILIKWSHRFLPLRDKVKGYLLGINRQQKRHLMFLHYYLNPAALGVVGWHYLSSRCVSTSLPEWGLFLLAGLMMFGILIKGKFCPSVIRKSVYQIHTQPIICVASIVLLTVGHLVVD
jgi:hypothetical protein